MVQILSFSLLAAGVALMLIAAVGVVRFPDLLCASTAARNLHPSVWD